MYKYEYVKIPVRGFFVREPEQDYHAVIEQYAKNGWRLVQILTPPTGSYGIATYFELIFEKQV